MHCSEWGENRRFFSCPERWSVPELTTCPQQRAYDRACQWCERIAVTGSRKDQCLHLQCGLPNDLGEAANSFMLTHHLWDTVCVSWTSVLWQIQIRKHWSCSVLLPLPLSDIALLWALLLPSCFGPAVWIPHQLVPPCVWRIRSPH